jgi:hypothetical protein
MIQKIIKQKSILNVGGKIQNLLILQKSIIKMKKKPQEKNFIL